MRDQPSDVSKNATHHAQKSCEHQSVRGLSITVKATPVLRKKEFQVQSSSSKGKSFFNTIAIPGMTNFPLCY